MTVVGSREELDPTYRVSSSPCETQRMTVVGSREELDPTYRVSLSSLARARSTPVAREVQPGRLWRQGHKMTTHCVVGKNWVRLAQWPSSLASAIRTAWGHSAKIFPARPDLAATSLADRLCMGLFHGFFRAHIGHPRARERRALPGTAQAAIRVHAARTWMRIGLPTFRRAVHVRPPLFNASPQRSP
jgi:hypothetical protein